MDCALCSSWSTHSKSQCILILPKLWSLKKFPNLESPLDPKNVQPKKGFATPSLKADSLHWELSKYCYLQFKLPYFGCYGKYQKKKKWQLNITSFSSFARNFYNIFCLFGLKFVWVKKFMYYKSLEMWSHAPPNSTALNAGKPCSLFRTLHKIILLTQLKNTFFPLATKICNIWWPFYLGCQKVTLKNV